MRIDLGTKPRPAADQPGDRLHDLPPAELGVHPRHDGVARVHAEERPEIRNDRPEILAQARDRGLDPVDDRGVRIRLADLEVPPEEIDQRMKRHGVSEGQAASLEPRRPVAHTLVELVEQAGFPDPGLSDDEDGVRLARRRAREGILQEVELALPPDERGQAPRATWKRATGDRRDPGGADSGRGPG